MRGDFSFHVGDDKPVVITVLDEAGEAIDITGASAIVWRCARYVGGPAVLTKTLGAGVTVVDADDGKFEVDLTASDTAAIVAGVYYWTAIVTLAGERQTINEGRFVAHPSIGAA